MGSLNALLRKIAFVINKHHKKNEVFNKHHEQLNNFQKKNVELKGEK